MLVDLFDVVASLLMALFELADPCGFLEKMVNFEFVHECDLVDLTLLDDVVGI